MGTTPLDKSGGVATPAVEAAGGYDASGYDRSGSDPQLGDPIIYKMPKGASVAELPGIVVETFEGSHLASVLLEKSDPNVFRGLSLTIHDESDTHALLPRVAITNAGHANTARLNLPQ